ncbi:MAG: alpha/beta hydrolase [Cytophagaceae bacterium]
MKLLIKSNKVTNLSYKESGEGNALVFLHGLFGGLSNWDNTIKYFNKQYRVIIPELPIYNGYASGEGLEGIVEYVHQLVEHLNLDKVTLVGNSLGGHVAILFTIKYPHLVDRLVLAGSSGLFENTMGESYPKRSDYVFIEEKVRYTFFNPNTASKHLVNEVYSTVNDIRKSLRIIKMVRSVNRNNVSALLNSLNLPVLLIWGKQDKITPLEVAYEFKKRFGDIAHLELIDNCGHAPMMECPDVFNQLLESFISKTILVNQAV